MNWVSESNRIRFRKKYLKPLMECDLVAFTIPKKPTSSKQKYKITDKGEKLVKDTIKNIENLYDREGWND